MMPTVNTDFELMYFSVSSFIEDERQATMEAEENLPPAPASRSELRRLPFSAPHARQAAARAPAELRPEARPCNTESFMRRSRATSSSRAIRRVSDAYALDAADARDGSVYRTLLYVGGATASRATRPACLHQGQAPACALLMPQRQLP